MLLVLLLGIADFGRVFSAGIVVEAMARNAAEAGALEYLQLRRATPGTQPPPAVYSAVFARAQEVACEEAERLPNTVKTGGACSMPVVGVCIHDDWGDHCSATTSTPSPACTTFAAWPPALDNQAGGLPYARVDGCYGFTTLLNISNLRLPLGWSLSIGDIWLQKSRAFTVADY